MSVMVKGSCAKMCFLLNAPNKDNRDLCNPPVLCRKTVSFGSFPYIIVMAKVSVQKHDRKGTERLNFNPPAPFMQNPLMQDGLREINR